MKSKALSLAGPCEHCGSPLARKRVRVYRQRGKRHLLFERVPALVCEECGLVQELDRATEILERGIRTALGMKTA